MADKPQFESLIEDVKRLISRRHSSWSLSSVLEWQDVQQELLIRLWQQYPSYDPVKGAFNNWANTVITNAINNLLRKHLYKYARPCISVDPQHPSSGPCQHNLGGGACAFTASKRQCSECLAYAVWQKKRREVALNIQVPISIERCTQQVSDTIHDNVDIDKAKEVIDAKILEQLNPHEAKIYTLLYIEHLPMEQVGEKMKYRKQRNSKIAGYQMLLKFSRKVKIMARQIIEDHDLT